MRYVGKQETLTETGAFTSLGGSLLFVISVRTCGCNRQPFVLSRLKCHVGSLRTEEIDTCNYRLQFETLQLLYRFVSKTIQQIADNLQHFRFFTADAGKLQLINFFVSHRSRCVCHASATSIQMNPSTPLQLCGPVVTQRRTQNFLPLPGYKHRPTSGRSAGLNTA
jgi:hypothetical protein